MWLIFGSLAIFMTGVNWVQTIKGKDNQLAMALALSSTALTLCGFYGQTSVWVIKEDMSALLDVVPYVSPWLWILTINSIVLNTLPIFLKSKNKI